MRIPLLVTLLMQCVAWGSGTGVTIYIEKAWSIPREGGDSVFFAHPPSSYGDMPSRSPNPEFSRPMDLVEGDTFGISLAIRVDQYLIDYMRQGNGPEYQIDKWVVNYLEDAQAGLTGRGLKPIGPQPPRMLVDLEVGAFRHFTYTFSVVKPEKVFPETQAEGVSFYTVMTEEGKSQWAGQTWTRTFNIAPPTSTAPVLPGPFPGRRVGGIRQLESGLPESGRVKVFDPRGRLLLDLGDTRSGPGKRRFPDGTSGPAVLIVAPEPYPVGPGHSSNSR